MRTINTTEFLLKLIVPERAVVICLFVLSLLLLPNVNIYLDNIHLTLLFVSLIFSILATTIMNNICDMHLDKYNKPNRVLVKNNYLVNFAYFWLIIFILLSFIYPISTYNPKDFLYIALILLGGFAYNFLKFKKIFIINYLTTISFYAMVPILWFADVFHVNISIYIIYLTLKLLFYTPIKDFEDVEGDRKLHIQTLVVKFNIAGATKILMCLNVALNAVFAIYLLSERLIYSVLFLLIISIIEIYLLNKKLSKGVKASPQEIYTSRTVKLFMSLLFFISIIFSLLLRIK